METIAKFSNDVASPYWWLSVVCVGLIINLASSYLKEPLDRWASAHIEAARIKSERRRDSRDAWIKRLSTDSRLLALEMQAEMRHGVSIAIASVALVLIQGFSLGIKTGSSPAPGYAPLLLFSTIATVLFLFKSIRATHVHYMNVELAKRAVLREQSAA